MTIADDAIDTRLRQSKEELDFDIERDLSHATVAGILSTIPVIGPVIQSLLDGEVRRNVERRWIQLITDLKDQLEMIRDSIPDESYYGSEEFQTLLALAYDQLWTTHDRKKLKMLAAALANSGSAPFHADDKELLIRALRDLSPSDIVTLNHQNLKGWAPVTKRIEYPSDVLSSLSRLAASGLVVDILLSPNAGAEPGQPVDIDPPPRRAFRISPLGERFLEFVASSEAVAGGADVESTGR